MAKKKKRKKKTSGPKSPSPKTYIKTKARQLPIHECLISEDWKETRMAVIVVARTHKNGHIS